MQPQWPELPTQDTTPAKPTNRLSWIVATVVVLGGLASGALVIANNSADDATTAQNDAPQFVVTQLAAAQPTFEPSFVEGDQPFFPLELQLALFTEQTQIVAGQADVETGLFGGTAETTCDPERLIEFLISNPIKGAAWAQAQDIAFADLPGYIRSLDVRVLAAPAAVINHGFDTATGLPNPVDAMLDQGTAVLVDANGDIRARCYCGNPVTPRPAVYRPRACVFSPALVMLEPGGSVRQPGALETVELSGQIATSDDSTWRAVLWGDSPADTGWTPDTNLSEGFCPRPAGATPPAPAVPTTTAPTVVEVVQQDPDPTATANPSPTSEPEPTATLPPATAAPVRPPAPIAPATVTPTPTPAAVPTPLCPDADGDGICNAPDNCRDVPNGDQADIDDDDKGDACDTCTDIDRDLHCQEGGNDLCPNDYDLSNTDSDGDGIGDVCDPDLGSGPCPSGQTLHFVGTTQETCLAPCPFPGIMTIAATPESAQCCAALDAPPDVVDRFGCFAS